MQIHAVTQIFTCVTAVDASPLFSVFLLLFLSLTGVAELH